MKEKNKVFSRAFDWLYQQGWAIDQADIAQKTGISATTISRIMNHGVGRPDEKTIRKLNAAFNNIFNPDFLRGQSDKMLVCEETFSETEINSNQQQLPVIVPDYSSMTNAIIAAKDDAIEAWKSKAESKEETIEALKRDLAKTEESAKRELAEKDARLKEKDVRLKEKDAMIDAKDAQLSEKDARVADQQAKIAKLEEQVAELKRRLSAYQSKDVFGEYHFPVGVSDDGDRPSAVK